MALLLRRTPGLTRHTNCTTTGINAAVNSPQLQQRWFSQNPVHRAKVMQEAIAMKRPAERSLKVQMKEASLDNVPTDLGLLPGTFVRPEGKSMPSIFTQPADRLRMEWVWLKTWFQNYIGLVAYHKYFFKGLPLRLKERRTEGMRLHRAMCTEFARGNQETLRQICCSGLASNLISRSRIRGPGEKVSWNLLQYNRTPSTWFTGARVISDRATQIPELPQTGIRQVVLRITSKQSTGSHIENVDPQTGRLIITAAPEKIRDCTEYIVIQKLRVKNEEKPWQVWGYAKPTTVEDLDNPLFSSKLTWQERLEIMQDMVQGRK